VGRGKTAACVGMAVLGSGDSQAEKKKKLGGRSKKSEEKVKGAECAKPVRKRRGAPVRMTDGK